jgi:hypothetical protein
VCYGLVNWEGWENLFSYSFQLKIDRVCNDRDLGTVLARLVNYLGHINALIYGTAFDEVSHVCLYSCKKS